MIEFFVPGHPITAHRPRLSHGRVHMDPEYLVWEEQVGYTALAEVDEPMDGYVVLALHFFSDSWAMQDIDNLSKAILDGLRGVLFHDDRQVVNLHLFKSQPIDEEGVLVRAWTPLEFALEYETALVELFSIMRKQEDEI